MVDVGSFSLALNCVFTAKIGEGKAVRMNSSINWPHESPMKFEISLLSFSLSLFPPGRMLNMQILFSTMGNMACPCPGGRQNNSLKL